jgi:hypothetical protein
MQPFQKPVEKTVEAAAGALWLGGRFTVANIALLRIGNSSYFGKNVEYKNAEGGGIFSKPSPLTFDLFIKLDYTVRLLSFFLRSHIFV